MTIKKSISMNGLRATIPRNLWILTLTSFLTDVSSEMVLSLLPLFLSNVVGVETGIIGLIEGIAENSSLLKVVSGWLSDRLRQQTIDGSRIWIVNPGKAVLLLCDHVAGRARGALPRPCRQGHSHRSARRADRRQH
jgi:hypothetical protein